jgi:thiamine-monophosphate kinase
MRLADVGELGLLAELERRGLAQAIEHDAAQLAGVVVTQDALVENVHFRLDWISWRDLGWRAAAVNLSDLAASGADAEGLIVALAAPGETRLEDVVELYEGIAETGVPVLGGDTAAARELVLSVTAVGRSPRVPGRDGAQPGDELVVTGPLGAAGATPTGACRWFSSRSTCASCAFTVSRSSWMRARSALTAARSRVVSFGACVCASDGDASRRVASAE